jgi:hypothetical protein
MPLIAKAQDPLTDHLDTAGDLRETAYNGCGGKTKF